jgi:hypothetical protein
MDLIFAIRASHVNFLSVEWTPPRPERSVHNVTQDHDRLG